MATNRKPLLTVLVAFFLLFLIGAFISPRPIGVPVNWPYLDDDGDGLINMYDEHPWNASLPSAQSVLAPDTSQDTWSLVEEGPSWTKYESDQHPGTYRLNVTATERIYRNGRWVDYLYTDKGTYYEVQTSQVELRIYPYYVEYWRNNFTEIVVNEEQWVLEYWRSQGGGSWAACDLYNPIFLSPVVDEYGVKITEMWTTDYPIELQNGFNITWWIQPCGAVKHEISIINKGYTANEFRVHQAWSGVTTDYVRVFNGTGWTEGAITTMQEVAGYIFDWRRTEKVWEIVDSYVADNETVNVYDWVAYPTECILYEDQWAAFNLLARTIFDTHAAGSKVDFIFENATLLTLDIDETALIDPTTTTVEATGQYFVSGSSASGTYVNTQDSDDSYHQIQPVSLGGGLYTGVWIYRLGAAGFNAEADVSSFDLHVEGKSDYATGFTVETFLRDCDGDSWTSMSTMLFSTSEYDHNGWTEPASNCWKYFDKDKESYLKFSYISGDYDVYLDHVYLTIGYTDMSGWADTNYGYRVRHAIAGSEDVTDYQMMLNITRASGTSSGNTIYVGSKCESDYDDIRFYNKAEATLLDYWIQTSSATYALVWVEVDKVYNNDWTGANPTDGGVIYVYYGYSSASAYSSGANTFQEFFDKDSTSGWTSSGITVTTSGDYLRFYNPTAATVGTAYRTDLSVTDVYICMTQFYTTSLSTNDQNLLMTIDGSSSHRFSWTMAPKSDAQGNVYYRHSGNYYSLYASYSEGTEYILTHKVDEGDSSTGIDYALYTTTWSSLASAASKTFAYGTPTDTDGILIGDGGSSAVIDAYYKWICFRKYSDNAPTDDAWGSEQHYNTAPSNDGCVLTNPTDTDNLYAQFVTYVFTVNVSDAQGFSDIDYVEMRFDDGATEWAVRFDEDTETWSEQAGATYIDLLTGSCENVSAGNDLDLAFHIDIEWVHPDQSDYDVVVYSIDAGSLSDIDTYNLNYDVETRLDLSAFSLTDGIGTPDRGNYNEEDSITASGTVVYYGSSANPPSGEVDVWVSCADVAGSPWSDLTLSSGQFSLTVDSDDVVGLDTYTFKVVQEGAGSGGSDESHTTHTDTYIADRVQVQSYSVSDNRININTAAQIDVNLEFDYDNVNVVSGSVTINGVSAVYLGQGGQWRITPTKSSVQAVTYNTVACSGNAHGITAVDQNSQSATVIWDRVVVTISNTAYYKLPLAVNASQNGSPVTYTAIYDYDDSAFDGSVVFNDTNWAHSTEGWYGYTASSVSGGAYGITALSTNEISILWQSVDSVWSHFWSQYAGTAFAHIDVVGLQWSVEGTNLPSAVDVKFYRNTTLFYTGNPTSGQVTGIVQQFDMTWSYVTFTVRVDYTTAPYYFVLYLIRTVSDDVPTWHTINVEVFETELDDSYLSLAIETNWHNASIFVFSNETGSYVHIGTFSEGLFQIAKPTTIGTIRLYFVINGTAGASAGEQDYSESDDDFWKIRTRDISVQSTVSIKFILEGGNGENLDEDDFTVTIDGIEVFSSEVIAWTDADGIVAIVITDEFGFTVYSNASYDFNAASGLVNIRLTLDIYTLYMVNLRLDSVYCTITASNAATRTIYIGVGDTSQVPVYIGSYSYVFYKPENNEPTNDNIVSQGTFTITNDDYTIVTPEESYPEDKEYGTDPNIKYALDTTNFLTAIFIGVIGILIFTVVASVFVLHRKDRNVVWQDKKTGQIFTRAQVKTVKVKVKTTTTHESGHAHEEASAHEEANYHE